MQIVIEPYDTGWPHRFAAFGADLRHSISDQSVANVSSPWTHPTGVVS